MHEKRDLKSVCIQIFSGLYFPDFGLNIEVYRVRKIQSKCGKIWSRKTLNMDTFYAVEIKIRQPGCVFLSQIFTRNFLSRFYAI